jgi:endo-1,4-beta-D-glucanase Y
VRRRLAAPQLLLGALAVVVVGALAAQLLIGGPRWWRAHESPGQPSSSVSASAGSLGALTAQEAGESFLSGYVEPDGRVTRRDEGGDTVSEGQAYAMLVAAALNDQQHFTRVWVWTKRNLAREDGRLAWRWKDGQVVDNASASDADLDAARALVIAAAAFGDDQLKAEGIRLGTAVLDKETVMTSVGRVLVAGSWANHPPYAYNPGYTSPAANALLADATHDERWAELDSGTRAVTTALLNSADLPPDWAQIHPDGRIDAMPGAAGRADERVHYGYDATRMPIRFAESCHPADVALAARLTPALDRSVGDPAVRDLDGTTLLNEESVVAAAAKAAALAAAGQNARAASQLLSADHLQQVKPTYYGAAWNALARLMLSGETLGGCPPLVGTI